MAGEQGAGQRRVLVVDDDAFVRTVVCRQVERLGMSPVSIGEGTDAQRIIRGPASFDLLICDLKMPGVDGVEVLRDLAQFRPDVGVILMSSADERTLQAAGELAKARQLRILGTLKKPVSAAELKDLLDRGAGQAPVRKSYPPVPEVSVEQLREGIAAGELDIHVQPKVSLRDGSLSGVEALARWPRPDVGMFLPAAFIGVAERNGLMDALTTLIARKALEAAAHWRDQGLITDIAINFPIESLDQLDLPDRLTAEARRLGVAPERVILEVTETGVMRDLVRSLDVMTRLRLQGYRLSVDDFGTGYSSLEQLKRFPFTELKLDRAFVDGASTDAGLRSIAESSLRMARQLKLVTCAEGVESRADHDLMRELGCDLVQGYFIARPLPKQDLPAWAKAHQASSLSRSGS